MYNKESINKLIEKTNIRPIDFGWVFKLTDEFFDAPANYFFNTPTTGRKYTFGLLDKGIIAVIIIDVVGEVFCDYYYGIDELYNSEVLTINSLGTIELIVDECNFNTSSNLFKYRNVYNSNNHKFDNELDFIVDALNSIEIIE